MFILIEVLEFTVNDCAVLSYWSKIFILIN